MKRMQHCSYCGKELGVYEKPWRERDTCGERECEREARADERAEREQAMFDAERDDYGRYR